MVVGGLNPLALTLCFLCDVVPVLEKILQFLALSVLCVFVCMTGISLNATFTIPIATAPETAQSQPYP